MQPLSCRIIHCIGAHALLTADMVNHKELSRLLRSMGVLSWALA